MAWTCHSLPIGSFAAAQTQAGGGDNQRDPPAARTYDFLRHGEELVWFEVDVWTKGNRFTLPQALDGRPARFPKPRTTKPRDSGARRRDHARRQ
jgi:hypothetical protein